MDRVGAAPTLPGVRPDRSAPGWLLHGLFFVSGATGLLFEMLQVAGLSRVFGQGPEAAAATLTALFLGLAAGAWAWGRWSARLASPLRTYGLLELAVAVTAGLGLVLEDAHRALYGAMLGSVGAHGGLLLALLVVGPPAFFMGGTLPVLGAYVVRRRAELGRRASLLYAVNTAGAAAGCVLGGFWLPPALGYRATWLLTMGVTAAVGLTALALSRRDGVTVREAERGHTPARLGALAFAAGFLALALQILWTRLFAQVFENTVQTFATIVALYLVALALGGGLARVLSGRLSWRPVSVLAALLVLSGLLVAVSGGVFALRTGGLVRAGVGEGPALYLVRAIVTATLVLVPAVVVLGSVFPYLWRAAEAQGRAPGRVIGALAGWNTLGAALGALAAGFVLLPGLGPWTSLRAVAAAYALLGLVLAVASKRRWLLGAGWTVLVATVGTLAVGGQPSHTRTGERLLGVWEGAAGTVTVVDREGVKKLRFNGAFTLGGTEDSRWEALQTHVAMLPSAIGVGRVFYLGMGTGITAGAALDHPVERVVVAELVPEVVEAARAHFREEVNGLFDDPRVEIVAEDARHRLAYDEALYDVVIGDIFFPWQAGTADLFTLEHFRAVKARLAPGGRFVQWLPCYQLSEDEFRAIARTMTEAFEQVTLWRGDFAARRPLLAVVGHEAPEALDPQVLVENARALGPDDATGIGRFPTSLPFFFYAGNLSAAGSLLARAPLLTDDRPWLAWEAPREQRRREAGETTAFVGPRILAFERALVEAVPIEDDPYLSLLSPAQRRRVGAGLALRALSTAFAELDVKAQRRALLDYVRHVPEEERPSLEDWVE